MSNTPRVSFRRCCTVDQHFVSQQVMIQPVMVMWVILCLSGSSPGTSLPMEILQWAWMFQTKHFTRSWKHTAHISNMLMCEEPCKVYFQSNVNCDMETGIVNLIYIFYCICDQILNCYDCTCMIICIYQMLIPALNSPSLACLPSLLPQHCVVCLAFLLKQSSTVSHPICISALVLMPAF